MVKDVRDVRAARGHPEEIPQGQRTARSVKQTTHLDVCRQILLLLAESFQLLLLGRAVVISVDLHVGFLGLCIREGKGELGFSCF